MIYNYTNSLFERYLTCDISADAGLIRSWIPPHVLEEEKEDLITACLSLYTNEMKENEKFDLCQAICYLPPSKRLKGVLSQYLIDTMSTDEKMIHIWTPSSTPEQEIMDRVQACLALYTSSMSVGEKYELFLSLNHVPALSRKNTVQATAMYLTPEMSVNEKMIYLWMPPSIPEQEKIDVVQACLFLFTNTMFVQEKYDIYLNVSTFPASHWKVGVQACLKYVTPEMSADEKLLHLWICLEVSEEERMDLVQACLSLFNSTMTVIEKWEVLRGLTFFPALSRRDVVQAVSKFLTPRMSADEILAHLWLPPSLPEEERTNYVEVFLVPYKKEMIITEKVKLFMDLSLLPAFQRTKKITQFGPWYFTPTMNVDEKLVHLWIGPSRFLSQTARYPLVQAVFTLFDYSMSMQERFELCLGLNFGFNFSPVITCKEQILTTLEYLTPEMSVDEKLVHLWTPLSTTLEERERLIQALPALYERWMTVKEKFALFYCLWKGLYNNSQYEERLQATSKFLTPEISVDERILHFSVPPQVSKEEREDLVKAALLLFTNKMGVDDKGWLLDSLLPLPALRRTVAVQAIYPYFTPTMSLTDKSEIIRALAEFPEKESISVLQAAQPLFLDGSPYGDILRLISILPPTQKDMIISHIRGASRVVLVYLYENSNIDFLTKFVAKKSLQEVIKKFTSLFSRLCKTDVSCDEIRTRQLLIFYLLPEDVLTQEALSKVNNITEFLEDEGCRTALIHAFEQVFQSNAIVPELLPKLAKFIIDYQDELLLHDEHQVMQHAIDILASKNIEEKKNPFALYKKLKQLKKELSTFCPTSQEVAGCTTAFCLASFRQSAFFISHEELPPGATIDAWQSLIDMLQDKMTSNEQAQAEVSIYDTNWETLWNKCFSDVYLSTLLQPSSATVSAIEAEWRAILQFILEQDKVVSEGKVFSAQEEALIKTAMTIQECKGGKQEGIASLYRLLDPKYRYPAKGFETGDIKKDAAFAFIAAQVELLFENQCSGTNTLMRELTNTQDIEQIAHQAIYLKNMIAPVIGLHHEVCFDRHTTVLYSSLVEKAREELLEAFFRHMTPQVVVTHLISMTNEKSTVSLFKRHLSAFIDILEEGKDWELGSDEITINFTAAGIVKVLRKMGYLTF